MRKAASWIMLILLIGNMLSLMITIRPTKAASATIYIRADGSIDPSDAPITTLDNVTYTLTGNITSDADGIVVERSDIIIDGDGYLIQGSGSGYGLNLTGMNNVTIQNARVKDFYDGIGLQGSSNNTITGNNVTNNDAGIYLYSSSDNIMSNNTLMSNRPFGFSVQGAGIDQPSSNNTFTNNTVTDSVCGFQFWGGGQYYNTVEKNLVYSNSAGIQLGDNAKYNVFRGNTMSNNDYGLMIMNGSEGSRSYGNEIFHNSFIDNVHQAVDNATGNAWDDCYLSGGNYWSDYPGVDTRNGLYQDEMGSDGIGDAPYSIDANNVDNYPLMGMLNTYDVTYFTPPIVAHACNVTVISNSTISAFVAPIWIEHPEVIFLEFNVSGSEGSIGFCRISFPTAMMNGTYHVSVNGSEIPYTLLPCSDANYSYLYFNYTHSTQEVIIIPEFPSFLILSLFMIVTLLAVTVYRRRIDEADG